jgi:hypothetical protein
MLFKGTRLYGDPMLSFSGLIVGWTKVNRERTDVTCLLSAMGEYLH